MKLQEAPVRTFRLLFKNGRQIEVTADRHYMAEGMIHFDVDEPDEDGGVRTVAMFNVDEVRGTFESGSGREIQ